MESRQETVLYYGFGRTSDFPFIHDRPGARAMRSMYKELGVRRVINGQFPVTRLGGSVLPQEVLDAMVEANLNWCSMWELEEKAGDAIAKICGAEAAHLTSGAYAALVLSAAACMAGKDPEKMRRLPDSAGMRNEILIQRNLRGAEPGMYDRSMEVAGGKLVEVGDEKRGAREAELEAAIGEKTAAIHFMVPDFPDSRTDIIPLQRVIEIGHKRGIPIIVDAAGQTYPTELLTRFTQMGADLVCYAAKYVHGDNSAGWVCGKKDLVEAVALHSFIGQEAGGYQPRAGHYKSVGRGYKLDRLQVVGTVVALQRWMTMDHHRLRIEPALKRAENLRNLLNDLSGIELSAFPDRLVEGIGYHRLGLRLIFPNRTAADVTGLQDKLREMDPSVWVYALGNSLAVNCLLLADGDERLVAESIRKLL